MTTQKWYQFSFKSLLVAITVILLVCFVIKEHTLRIQAEQLALEQSALATKRASEAQQIAALAAQQAQEPQARERIEIRIEILGEPSTKGERQAVETTIKWLKQERTGGFDVELGVSRKGSDYLVSVVSVTGRDKAGMPHYSPGAHCMLMISSSGAIKDIFRGA
jgi:hypothetical protein